MLALGSSEGILTLLNDDLESQNDIYTQSIQAHAPTHSYLTLQMLVAMSPCGSFVVSVSPAEFCWKLWDVETGGLIRTGESHDGTGACLCTRPFPSHNHARCRECKVPAHMLGDVLTVNFSPRGHIFAIGGNDVTFLWDVATGAVNKMLLQGSRSSSFSGDGNKLATARPLGVIDVWDVSTGNLLTSITDIGLEEPGGLHRADLFCLQYHPNEPWILSVSQDEVKISNVNTGVITRLSQGIGCASISPDGHTIATLNRNHQNVVQFFNWQGVEIGHIPTGHNSVISCLVFSGDSRRLVTCSREGSCNIHTGLPVRLDMSGGASFEDILAEGTQLNRIQLGIGIYSVSWGYDIVGMRNRREAFAMGVHRRIGEASSVRSFGDDVAKMVMEYM